MAGNSQRKGAMRKEGTKKGMTVGSGGQRRKGLKGKGPTPKAEERTKHPAARRARAAEKATARKSAPRGKRSDGREVLVGRNPVVEALRAGVPASALYAQAAAIDQGIPEKLQAFTRGNKKSIELPKEFDAFKQTLIKV